MKGRRPPSLAATAVRVGDALRRGGIRGVLTGGACASLYTGGRYQSADVDIIPQSAVPRRDLDAAMESIGFSRRRDRYVHATLPFYVEFPRGPLAIGADHRIRPVERGHGRARALVLSPTDSCRDRLAAFYHWDDRQSLEVAIVIARRNRVNMAAISRWSRGEGAVDRFREFSTQLKKTGSRGTRQP